MTQNNNDNQVSLFEKEIARLPNEIKSKLIDKANKFKPLIDEISKLSENKTMGFFINPEIEVKNNMPSPNYDKLTLNFLLDDFEKPVQFFDPRILLGDKFNNFLIEEKKTDNYNQQYSEFYLKADKSIKFYGTSISVLRENCFDGIYDDLKSLGTSFIYSDERGFISALKTIDIHRNMLLQKFEKYVVVYAGAGSWLRGEKSNDFDVFVVIDDTDVKRMPRMQVKDQLTKIIWQMAREVGALTGVDIHIQVYLLTDFWDALKDAHPVMFTFLRDGVPFYDRGIYSAWKELLKLGKIRPSPEAIDMHMNVGTQLVDRAKKMFSEIWMNEIYHSFLNPAQAVIMLKGYNPTTPKETLRMFKEVLVDKEKSISQKDYESLKLAVETFKKIEHDKDTLIQGKDLDKMISSAETYLANIKKLFEEITEQRTKESIVSSYNELITQISHLPGFSNLEETDLVSKFKKDYVETGLVPEFVKDSLVDIEKSKKDYDKGKITTIEVNKVLKEIRNVLIEIKTITEKDDLSKINNKKLVLTSDDNKTVELFSYDSKVYLINLSNSDVFELKENSFYNSEKTKENFNDFSKYDSLELTTHLLNTVKEKLGISALKL